MLYRYASKLIIKHKPYNSVSFLKKKFNSVSYNYIAKQNLHSEEISNHVVILSKNLHLGIKNRTGIHFLSFLNDQKLEEIVTKIQEMANQHVLDIEEVENQLEKIGERD